MDSWKIWAVAGAAVVVIVGVVSWPGGQGNDYSFIDAGDAGLVAEGRKVYADQCASCHGANLEGQPNWRNRGLNGRLPAPPHDASGHTWHHPDGLLFTLTKEGIAALSAPGYVSDMEPFKDKLSDRQIAASLAYIKSRWPSEIRKQQEDITRRAIAEGK